MKKFWTRAFIFTATAVLFYATSWGVFAQNAGSPYRATDRQVSTVLLSLERNSDAFRSTTTAALDRSSFNNTRTEDEIINYINDFEDATDNLKRNFEGKSSVGEDVTDVIGRAANINRFLQQYRLSSAVTTSFARIRTDLTTLARYYGVAANFDQPVYNNNAGNNNYPNNNFPNNNPNNNFPNNNSGNNNFPNNNSNNRANFLTGTYRLDVSRSTDVQAEIDRAAVGLNANQRDRATRQALRRLEAPEELAIERSGRTITLASTKSPRASFEADGQTRTEQNANGRTFSVNAALVGDQLTINYTGDRVNDFYVAFNPNRNGDELRVTRRIYLEGVDRQITTDSIYVRTSNAAQLDNIFRGNNAGNNYPNDANNAGSTNYIIPDNTQIVAVLQNDITTNQSQEGDRFTMEVTSPAEFRGAIIEGRVGSVARSGRVSGRAELALNFETIRLRNNSSYNFRGIVSQVRGANGENVQIDNEGAVREGDSQTKKTVGRTAIGAALGAVIGAIAGGGKGAAIGAGVGAGAGAGSVILQGRDDLNLKSGTEVTITSSAPRSVSSNR